MMSNNLVPPQLSMHGVETGQLEQFPNKVDSSMQMGLMKPGSNDPAQQLSVPNNLMGPASGGLLSQQMSMANNQAQLLQPMPNGNLLQRLPMANMGRMDLHAHNMAPTQLMMPNRQFGEMEAMFNSAGTQQILTPNKRKSPMEPTSNSSLSQKLLLSNIQAAHMEHRPWLQQTSAPQKVPAQTQPVFGSFSAQRPTQTPSKRSNPSKSGPQQLPVQKKQTVQFQPSPKGQSESNDSMRSKLRQSLADALALVSQQENKPSSAENNSLGVATSSHGQAQGNPHAVGSTSGTAGTIGHNIETLKESMAIKEDSLARKYYDGQNSGQESSSIFRDEDATFSDSFFVKDELLQGNGLSWVMEADAIMGERKDIEATQKKQDEVSGAGVQTAEDPKILATKIEAELFKYFGGVNKKYKEKGRSLLFNLKDRSNPELRERVMSGDILPERLCSMTAEELASKELSEWRMAKAEELAQMVVLPDDVDVRRLVKKTHKGEFQVEVEHQDSISMDVAAAPSSVAQVRPKLKQREASPTSKPRQTDQKSLKLDSNGVEKNLGDKEIDCTITIPSSEGADLMQGLMVDDELKDVDFLPPIVSLDEFMESLDSEPPFEGLPVDAAGKTTPLSDKDGTEVGSDSKSPNKTSSSPVDTTPDKPDNIGATDTKLDDDGKSPDSHGKPDVTQASTAPKSELVWEGLLQLSISSTASVIGIYKSGEKATAKEWSGSVEIKGRVRLDAFEKFLQELPMSRSRSVMAIHLFCKEGSSESERGSLNEVAESYAVDGRVGFAEPSPGVELYLCPPQSKSRDMLVKVLPKDQTDALNAIDNGLIGVIVWRKAHVISPNSASHHKHNSKKHTTSRKPQSHEKQTSTNVNVTPRHPLVPRSSGPQPDDEEDDVPPGFGPPAARDEDDLPEFNFSSGGGGGIAGAGGDMMPRPRLSHQNPRVAPINQPPQALARPSEQMRELVHRYGQSNLSAPAPAPPPPLNRGYGVAVEPWDDDDDDDDMPEWRPETNAPLQNLQPPSVHLLGQQPNLRAQMVQQPMTVNAFHGQQNVASWQQQQQQQQGAWVVPPGSNGHPIYQTNGGQAYGGPAQQQAAWSRDATRSRGF